MYFKLVIEPTRLEYFFLSQNAHTFFHTRSMSVIEQVYKTSRIVVGTKKARKQYMPDPSTYQKTLNFPGTVNNNQILEYIIE
jgi:hypothetical protein